MATPIDFKQRNKMFVGPKGSNMRDLPAFNDGRQTIACWQLTPEEIAEITKTGVIWISQMAGKNFYPQNMFGTSPFHESPDAFSWIRYEAVVSLKSEGESIHVLNLFDGDAPVFLDFIGRKWRRDKSVIPIRYFGEPMTKGALAIAASGAETIAEGMSGKQFVVVEAVNDEGVATEETAFDIPALYYH